MEKRTKEQEAGYHELTGYDLGEEVKYWEQEKAKVKKELEELQDNLGKTKEWIEKEEAKKEGIIKREEEFQEKLNHTEILFKEAEEKLKEERENIRRAAEEKKVLEEECRVVSGHIQELREKNAALDELDERINKPKRWGRKILALVLGLGLVFAGISVYMEKVDLEQRLEAQETLAKNQVSEAASAKEEAEEQLTNVISEKEKTESQLSEAVSAREEAEGQLTNAISEKEKAEKELSDVKAFAGDLLIKVNSTYNADEDGSKLSDKLIAKDMRFLHFDYDVLFLRDDMGSATIYLDIYKPDGDIKDSINSPAGHSFSVTVSSSGGYGSGWGNSEESTYEAGTYRVDFIYMDRIIYSKKFNISS